VNSSESDRLGAFPIRGPLTYLRLTPAEVQEALAGPYRLPTVWFHMTHQAEAASAAWQGLIPSCWVGGDGCCVFGADRPDASALRGDWVLEICSRALPEQQRAWWVPAAAIRGGWHADVFYGRAALRELGPPLLSPTGSCACELTRLVAEQVGFWFQMTGEPSR
jgi:hypothetical protein